MITFTISACPEPPCLVEVLLSTEPKVPQPSSGLSAQVQILIQKSSISAFAGLSYGVLDPTATMFYVLWEINDFEYITTLTVGTGTGPLDGVSSVVARFPFFAVNYAAFASGLAAPMNYSVAIPSLCRGPV